MLYQNSFTTIKEKLFPENSSSALQQSIELSSSSEIDNIIQEGEVIFKKNPTVGLPEVSKLIDSAIKRDKVAEGNTAFSRKKRLPKMVNRFTMNRQKHHIT